MPSTAMPPSQVRASHQLGDVLLEARHGDICFEDVGAIVNAANEALRHGGGVAKAISTAAGHDNIVQRESTEWVRENGLVHTGRVAAITSAGALPCKHVVHVTGPIWRQRVETLNEIEVRGEVTAVEDGTGGVRRATLMTAECGTVTFDCLRAAPGYVPQAGDRVRALVSKPAPAPPGVKGGKKQYTVRFACGTKHEIQQSDEELLAGAVMAALRKADEVGCKSVALPAISSGIFGFPLDLCAKILVECGVAFAREGPKHITRIAYTNIDSRTVTALVNACHARPLCAKLLPQQEQPPAPLATDVVLGGGGQWQLRKPRLRRIGHALPHLLRAQVIGSVNLDFLYVPLECAFRVNFYNTLLISTKSRSSGTRSAFTSSQHLHFFESKNPS